MNLGTHFIKARELLSSKNVLGEVVESPIESENKSKDSVLLMPLLKNGGIHGEWYKHLQHGPKRSELPKMFGELKIFLAEVVDSSLDFKNACEIGDVVVHILESIPQLLCGFTIGIRFNNWRIKRVLKKTKDSLIRLESFVLLSRVFNFPFGRIFFIFLCDGGAWSLRSFHMAP